MADDFDVDKVIRKLLKEQTETLQFQLTQRDVKTICKIASDLFVEQPMLLRLEPPVNVCGDIHGQFADLIRVFELAKYPPDVNYLFLGDYVDRGQQSVETICLLLSYKIKYPENFFMLRGNHEDYNLNRVFGFYDECLEKCGKRMYKSFLKVFRNMPVAAIIGSKIYCAHGGISPSLTDWDQIETIPRPVDIPTQGLLCDILWSDPTRETRGWAPNERGVSFTFGEDVVNDFLKRFELDLICRAHEVVADGFEFFAGRQLVTVFSAPNYCDFDNAGAVLVVGPELMCSFLVLKPDPKKISVDEKKTGI